MRWFCRAAVFVRPLMAELGFKSRKFGFFFLKLLRGALLLKMLSFRWPPCSSAFQSLQESAGR